MKRFILFSICSFVLLSSLRAQKDLILKRDGMELQVKIVSVGFKQTTYKLNEKEKGSGQKIDNTDIYMIKYDRRGTLFFTEKGESFKGKAQNVIPSDAVLIYKKIGEVIVAFEIGIDKQNVMYKTSNNSNADIVTVSKDDIFMVKYPDGTKDIFAESNPSNPFMQGPKGMSTQSGNMDSSHSPNRNKTAIIKTHAKATIKAIIVDETNLQISFYRSSSVSGPLYQIDKSRVESIDYIK